VRLLNVFFIIENRSNEYSEITIGWFKDKEKSKITEENSEIILRERLIKTVRGTPKGYTGIIELLEAENLRLKEGVCNLKY
tara:strand:- start:3334 stop:3576 length:243 start_codon:yes stop_codon:yes gene_type:complete